MRPGTHGQKRRKSDSLETVQRRNREWWEQTGLKLALSGLRGDELFDGYGYGRRVSLLQRARRLPAPLAFVARQVALRVLRGTQASKADVWLSGGFDGGTSYEFLRRLFLPKDVQAIMGRVEQRNGVGRPASLDPRRELHKSAQLLELTNYTKTSSFGTPIR